MPVMAYSKAAAPFCVFVTLQTCAARAMLCGCYTLRAHVVARRSSPQKRVNIKDQDYLSRHASAAILMRMT